MPYAATNTTKGKPPRLPFMRIAEEILGPSYDLSVAFISPARSRTLNRTYRKKDRPANVLSFPLEKSAGELFIDLATARAQAPDYGETYREFILHLFIHGLLHLKGLQHGSKMEREEHTFRSRFAQD